MYLVNSFTLLWNYRTSKRARLIRSSIQGITLVLDIEDSCRQRPCTKRVENKIKATKNISFDKYCTQILTFKLFTLQVSFSHSSSNVYVQWSSTFWAEKLRTMTRHFISRNKKIVPDGHPCFAVPFRWRCPLCWSDWGRPYPARGYDSSERPLIRHWPPVFDK